MAKTEFLEVNVKFYMNDDGNVSFQVGCRGLNGCPTPEEGIVMSMLEDVVTTTLQQLAVEASDS